MPSLILVRHGQASFGAASYDVLSETGHAQARLAAAELQRRGVRPARVISGSLSRQLDTAAEIAAEFGLGVDVDARWNEYATDDVLQHHSSTDARVEHPARDAPTITSRDFQGVLETALHGWITSAGDSGARETWPAFLARVQAALDSAFDGLGRGASAIVTTSGGAIAATCATLLGTGPASTVSFNRVAINGAITTVTAGRGGRTLVSFNEHGHLQGRDPALLTYR